MAKRIQLYFTPVCTCCLKGDGGECHTPGCAFWMMDAPEEALQYSPEALTPLPNQGAVPTKEF